MTYQVSNNFDLNIEDAFAKFNDDQLMLKLDDKVIKNEAILKTDEVIGSQYLQEYKEGRKVKSYIVKINKYENQSDCKLVGMKFDIDNKIFIELEYQFKYISENQTLVTYICTTTSSHFLMKLLMKLSSKKSGTKMCQKHLDKMHVLFMQ